MLTQTLKTVRDWVVRRQEKKALGGFSGAELMAGSLTKAGLLEAMEAPADTRRLMSRMAEMRGVRPDVLEHDTGRTWLMAGACSRCRSRTLCRDWLDGEAETIHADWFCPNAHHFDELNTQ